MITKAYNQRESYLLKKLSKRIKKSDERTLNSLVGITKSGKPKPRMQRPLITQLCRINQSLRPTGIQENIKAFEMIGSYFYQFQDVIDQISLSDQATEYHATWVQKAETFQLSNFSNKNKLYLYLLAYIKHQYYFRQDILIDIFLKSVQAAINAANKQLQNNENSTRSERNKAIKKLSASNKDSRLLIEEITAAIKCTILSEKGKLLKIEELIDQYHTQYNEQEQCQLVDLENSLNKLSKDKNYFDVLELISIRLQRRTSGIVKLIEFNSETSEPTLIEAINYFKSTNADIGPNAPIEFLDNHEKDVVYNEGKLRISLYKILLFIHIANAIKSGKLNLKYSYRYKAVHEYLIEKETWKQKKSSLLKNAGLYEYANFDAIIKELKNKLNEKYHSVNQHFNIGENKHLTIENNKMKLITPRVENNDMEYISSILTQTGYVPILQILYDINQSTNFVDCFKHFSIKHKKMKPKRNTIFAGIIGKGCNIGINRIANISVGVTEDILSNTVNWCFVLKNIQNANNKIIALINKLALANSFKQNPNQLHTGSDGRKLNIGVDSLHANYSYKYFGKGKGVTMYTFLDEQQILFHSLVMSASEREAAYVIDGLMGFDNHPYRKLL